MSYVKHVLQPDEKVVHVGKIGWIVYGRAILFFILGCALLILEQLFGPQGAMHDYLILATAILFGIATLISFVRGWFVRWTTEIAVTDRRIIYKRGFIRRHTEELNMDKVASVDVDQSILGRVFNFGTVQILGTGGARGIERLSPIDAPIALRNAIDAR